MASPKIALLVILITFAAPSFAEELSSERRADIEQLLQMTGALAVGQQMSEAVVAQMVQILRKARPDIPQRMLDVLPEEVNAVIIENMDNLKGLVVPLYGKYFTSSEIKEMIGFYSTPLGKKAIQTMPLLMRESMQAGQQWGQSLGPDIQQRIKARFKKEGYEL